MIEVMFTEQVNAMGPLIDNELERVDRKHAQLTQVSSGLVEALNLYHMLMREPYPSPKPGPFPQPPHPVSMSVGIIFLFLNCITWKTYCSYSPRP